MSLNTLRKTLDLVKADVLYAPNAFKLYSPEKLKKICNGCGAADSWFRPPSKIYGTSIVYACHIHDFMYETASTIEDKDEADRIFLNNMNRLITRDSKKWYKPTWLQRRRALKYYYSVKNFGGSAFWKGKN